ncbi:MAG TPA: cysteine desulfurase-like protein [Actinomycetota bacterium]
MGLDVEAARKRFPALERTIEGRPCVFADAPAGTQVPEVVIDAMADYLRRSNANVGGVFATSLETDEAIAAARRSAADLLGCDPREVVFGPNMTTLSLALSRAVARELGPGDELVVTVLDHDANVAPWLLAAEDRGATVRWANLDEVDCTLDLASLERALGGRTRVVALTLASNAVGSLTPVDEVVAMVRERAPEAILVGDAVHLAPHRSIDAGPFDAVLCSPYKFFGPHLGIMAARRGLLERLRPYKVRPAPEEPPDRWETGTQSHEALAGLTAAISYLRDLVEGEGRRGVLAAMEEIREHESLLSRRFLEGITRIPAVRLYGIGDPERVDQRTPTFAIRVGGQHPRSTAEKLARRGIFVWDGNYYALAIMERLGLENSGGAVRIGFCHYHTEDEVDRVLEEVAALAAAP